MTEVATITLVEFQTRAFDPAELPEREAHRLHIQFGDKITIEWPTAKTHGLWQLTSKGWVGYIPIGRYGGISLKPKVPLANLFGMLEYAYDLRSFRLLEGLYDMESIKDFYERLAAVLAERVLKRVREGLYRTYLEEYAADSFVRGRIDMATLCRSPVKSKIACYSENHTIDIEDNQIVAWTLHTIARSGLIFREKPSKLVRKADRTLRHSISLNFFSSLDCINRIYNRLNADYDVLHKLCRFFLENTGPTLDAGDRSMVPFLIDMSRLFELFVARWLKERIDSKFTLRRQESLCIGNQGALRMQMDILICDTASGKPLCVVDTKYKADNNVSGADYNQVVAYADAVGCREAVLVYPGKIQVPFDEKPGGIRVRTAVFDLAMDLDIAGERLLQRLYAILKDADSPEPID